MGDHVELRPWQAIIPERDRQVYERGGFGGRQPMGRSPALLIVDVTESFMGSRPEDVLGSQAEYRTSCGSAGWEALPAIRSLLEACRSASIPVIYTKGDPEYKDACGSSTKGWTRGEGQRLHTKGIPELIAPREGEFVLRKTKASPFFGSPLVTYLHTLGTDTLFVVGTTTSGCVRAAVIDAFSYNYKVFVVEEACFDRSEFSHLVNLFEMNCKYADVIRLEEALSMVSACRSAADSCK